MNTIIGHRNNGMKSIFMRRFLLPFSILLSLTFSPPPASASSCLPLPSDAAHWWRAEGNTQDSIGLNHGTLEGGALYDAGKVGEGFRFDGIDDLVAIPAQGFPAGTSDRTLEVWVKIDALVAQEAYFAGYGLFGATGASYNIGASFGRLYFSSWGPDLFGPQVSLGQWHHVAATNVGSLVTLYLDGIPVNSASLPIDVPPEGTQFFIGKVGGIYGDIRRLQGMVDEVTLYTRALTLEEISAIYQAGSSGKCAPESPTNQPVILIPGITGSWNWNVLLHDESGGTWQFPPFTNVYQPLIEKLKEEGYEEGKTLFIAFYDWRQPNVISAQQYLKPIIDQAKQVSGKDKVGLIGHSMGGILARAYIQGSHYENDVDQLITLGTPHYGSGDAYTVWEGGHVPDNWDTGYRNSLKGYLFFRTLDIRERSWYHEMHISISSLRDLLPTYDYLKDKTTNTLKLTNTLHEQNTFLNVFNPVANELNSLVRTVTTVAGDDQYTVGEIPFVERLPQDDPLWADGKPDPLDPERNKVEGDNTVLLTSAHLQEAMDQVTFPDTTHRDLVSKAAPAIFPRLGLPDPGTLELVAEPESILAFWFASPVAPTVTDSLGNSISKDASTIPDAVYFGEDDPNGKKMILIPNPTQGHYQVDLVGTGEGHYDFSSAFFKQNVPDAMQVFSGEVHQGTEITYDADVNPENPEHPISTEIVDTEPPILNIPSPQHESKHLDSEMLYLALTGADSLSGLAELTLFLDNTLISSTTTTSTIAYLLDLSLTPLGFHTVKGTGKDNTGNTAVIETLFKNTTSYDAILQNLDHYESLGLIHPLTKRILVPQVKAAQKLAQQYAIRHNPGLKLALNKLLDALIIEVQKLKARGLIHHTAFLHLQEEFLALKL